MAHSNRIIIFCWTCWAAAVILSPFLPDGAPSSLTLAPPDLSHPLGTTPLGVDLLWTVSLAGLRAEAFAILAAVLACIIALPLGLLAARSRGNLVNDAFGIAATILDAISPIVILAVLLAALPDTPPVGLAAVLGLIGWTFLVGPIQRATLDLRASSEVYALRAIGYSRRQIFRTYLLPELTWRLAPQVTALATIYVGALGAVEFLALGMRRQQSLGYLVLDSLERLDQSPRYFVTSLATCLIAIFVLSAASISLASAGRRRKGSV
jgi:peptide/nickel transport system permease protein